MAGVTICIARRQFGQTLTATPRPPDRSAEGAAVSGRPLEHRELMPERENFRRELEPRADRGSQRGQQGDEQRSHPARERYQSVVRNRNSLNRDGIFSRDSGTPLPDRRPRGRKPSIVLTSSVTTYTTRNACGEMPSIFGEFHCNVTSG